MTQAKSIIPELVRTHSRITDLMAGCLPERVNETLEQTGYSVLKELADARANTWKEFADKVATLVGALPHDPLPGWLNRLRDSFAEDVYSLPALSACDMVEAAE
jgi:hypothetical protein